MRDASAKDVVLKGSFGGASVADGLSRADENFSAAVEAVTSIFGDRTRREIYMYARDEEGVTATQVANRFSLHPNVARHHLEKLAASGYLEVSPGRRSASSAGRPSKLYVSTSVEPSVEFPQRRDDLLVTLLAKTLALLDTIDAERIAEEVGEEYGRGLAQGLSPEYGQRSLRASLSAIADALTAHGFAAHAEARGASLAVISEHCPFGDAASQHPVICAVDRGIIKGMLASLHGRSVTIVTSSKARGDNSCAVVV